MLPRFRYGRWHQYPADVIWPAMPMGTRWEEMPLFYFDLRFPHRHWSIAILDTRVLYTAPPGWLHRFAADPEDEDEEEEDSSEPPEMISGASESD